MRSRYAAYALGKVAYIMATSGMPEPDQEAWRASIRRFCDQADFVGLDILDVEPGDSEAFVTFRARIRVGEHDASFVERSRFVRREDWVYMDGERRN